MTLDSSVSTPSPLRLRTLGHNAVTAVLIVKDEEAVVARCLASLEGFVDAVILYDTGSQDRTREIARESGALVVEGYWDDDFAAARNRALALADGEWVLSIDADEVLVGSPTVLRAHLRDFRTDVFEVDVVSLTDDGGTTEAMRVARLFRRALVQWTGSVHEQVTPRRLGRRLRGGEISEGLHLEHSGYRSAEHDGKGKAERNLRIARATHVPDEPITTVNLGRALVVAGRSQEAAQVMEPLLAHPADPRNMVLAARCVIPYLIQMRAEDHFHAWIAAARRHGETYGQLATWEGALAFLSGRDDQARSLLQGVLDGGRDGCGTDPWDLPFDPSATAVLLSAVYTSAGDPAAAAAVMRSEVLRIPHRVNLPYVFSTLGAAGFSMADLVGMAPPAFLSRALREMTTADPASALRWFSEHHAQHPDDPRPLVAGSVVASNQDWRTALEWSMKTRELGADGLCALTDLTSQEWRSPTQRAVGLTFLAEGFGDEGARSRLTGLLASLSAPERDSVVRHVLEVVPGAELPLPVS